VADASVSGSRLTVEFRPLTAVCASDTEPVWEMVAVTETLETVGCVTERLLCGWPSSVAMKDGETVGAVSGMPYNSC
jgi:hypothetical protein